MSRGAQLFLWVRPGKGRGFEGLREAITARLDQLTIASRTSRRSQETSTGVPRGVRS